MAIKIAGSTIIDNSISINNIGISTIGSGSSTVTLNSIPNFIIGVGATLSGNGGNISIAGSITATALSIPLSLG